MKSVADNLEKLVIPAIVGFFARVEINARIMKVISKP